MDLTKIILGEKDIPLIVTESVETMSYVKGYLVYKALWTPVIRECLLSQREPDNPEDKYTACLKKKEIGHLPLGRSGKVAKTNFYFLRADELSVKFLQGYHNWKACKLGR